MKKILHGWMKLIGVVLLLAATLALVHLASPHLPGMAGDVFRNNIEQNVEATALIYSESGDIKEYLDDSNGRYGGAQLDSFLP